jgi:septal ring factor EnvC (AmiA/AmiB activator)
MKAKNREFKILNISFLDRQELAKTSQRLEETETELDRAEERSRELEQELQKSESQNSVL